LQLIVRALLVEIVPLLCVVDSQPDILARNLLRNSNISPFPVMFDVFKASQRAGRMQASRIAGNNICRTLYAITFSSLISPVLIRQWVLLDHRCEILLLASA